jgi:hypothetical protein
MFGLGKKGRGWHGDSAGHARAGRNSSGNPHPSEEAQRKG